MSEFGNETATAAMRTGEKTLEAIFKLLRFITEMKRAKTDAEYKSAMMKQYKMKSTEAEAKEYLNNSRGKIRKEKLEQSGEKIIPISTPLSKEELRTFNNYANSYGVPFAAIADKPFNEQIKK